MNRVIQLATNSHISLSHSRIYATNFSNVIFYWRREHYGTFHVNIEGTEDHRNIDCSAFI